MAQPTVRSRRWVAWALLGLAVGTVAALWFGPRYVDWRPFKPDVEALIEKQLGIGMTVKGGMQIDILPQPRITLATVTVDGPGPQGSIRWVRGRLDPSALIVGRLIPQDLTLVEPDLTLPINHGAAAPYAGETAATVENGRLVLQGGPDWLPGTVEAIHGRLSLGGSFGRLFAFDGEARVADEPIGLSLEGRTGGGLTLALAHGPSAADLALEGGPDGTGGWKGRATLVLEEAGFLSTLRADGLARLLGEGQATLDARIAVDSTGILNADLEALESTRLSGSGRVDLLPGSPRSVFLTLDLGTVRWQDGAPGPARLSDDLAHVLARLSEIVVEVDLHAESIATDAGTMRDAALLASLYGGEARISSFSVLLPGETRAEGGGTLVQEGAGWRFDGRASLASTDLRGGLATLFPEAGPALANLRGDRLRDADLSAHLLIAPGRLDVTSLSGSLDGTAIAGAVTLDLETGADIVLQADRINFDRYRLPSPPENVGEAMLPALANLLSRGAETRAALFVDQAIIDGVPVGGLGLDLVRRDGTLAVTAEIGDLSGAAGSVDLTLDPIGNSDGRIELDVPAPDRLLGALGVAPRQAARAAGLGRTALRIDLSGSTAAGVGFALEALGSRGDLRLTGLAVPGPAARVSISDGALNLPDLTLFDLAGDCRRSESGWTCGGLRAALPGLRLEGRADLSDTEGTQALTVTIDAARADLGLFASRARLPLIPEGDVVGSGVLTGSGPDPASAAAALSGTLDLSGTLALSLPPGGGGQIGDLDRLRERLETGFGAGAPLQGTLDIAPEAISSDLVLDGAGMTARADATLRWRTERLSVRLDATEDGQQGDPALTVEATGTLGAPRVTFSGGWLSGR